MPATATADRVIREGVCHAKGNATDPEYRDYAVREWAGENLDGYVEYYHVGIAKWCELPKAWADKIRWGS